MITDPTIVKAFILAQGNPWALVTTGCGIPPEVPALARAAQKSHVFGGMGN